MNTDMAKTRLTRFVSPAYISFVSQAEKVDGSTRRVRKKKKKRISEQNATKLVRCSTCLILERGEVPLPGGAGFSFLLLLLLPLLVGDVAPQQKLHHFYAHVGISVAPTRRRQTKKHALMDGSLCPGGWTGSAEFKMLMEILPCSGLMASSF